MVTPLPTPDVTPTNVLSVLQGVAALEPALDGSRPPPPATPIDIVASEAGVRQQAVGGGGLADLRAAAAVLRLQRGV